jgi:hypothetical protein
MLPPQIFPLLDQKSFSTLNMFRLREICIDWPDLTMKEKQMGMNMKSATL